MSFTDVWGGGTLKKKKQLLRERFPAQLDELIPWSDLLAVIEPHYPCSGNRGRPPIGLEVILRIHLMRLARYQRRPEMAHKDMIRLIAL